MIAVVGGLVAALSWATGTLSAARASRLVGPRSVLAWVMLLGFLVTAPLAAAQGVPAALGRRELAWFALAGAANVGGLLLAYEAMRVGKVSIVAPITSTEGALAALLAVAAGESLGAASASLLAVIACGVVLASLAPSGEVGGVHTTRSTACAVAAALAFGLGLYATAKVSTALPLLWAVLPPRVVGMVVVVLPSLAARRMRIERAAVPFVLVSSLCEVVGFFAYALGARHSIAVTAVLASQFAAIAAAAAFVIFHERLRAVQVAGIVIVFVSVALLSVIRA